MSVSCDTLTKEVRETIVALLESAFCLGVAVLFAVRLQAQNDSFREQERLASCVFALAPRGC